jgi:hypothetical protein
MAGMPMTPPAVRVLPMSANEPTFRGLSVEDVQARFFLEELPSRRRNGQYLYPGSGLATPPGSVVLFQYLGRVVASAEFVRDEKFPGPRDGYRGALWFDPATVRAFGPVDADGMRRAWPGFVRFGQAKRSLDPAGYAAFERGLSGVAAPRIR